MRRRLEDEPLLAARIVVEDCLNLLLDVDDIDRLWAASGGVPSSSSHQHQQQPPQQRDGRGALRQRRSLLLEVCNFDLRYICGGARTADPADGETYRRRVQQRLITLVENYSASQPGALKGSSPGTVPPCNKYASSAACLQAQAQNPKFISSWQPH